MSDQAVKWATPPAPARFPAVAVRYALSTLGPISVSGAHFVASIIFLHTVTPFDFGLFSFLLVVVPFLGVSVTGSLLIAPLGNLIVRKVAFDAQEYSTLLKIALIASALVGVAAFGFLWLSRAPLLIAALAAPYATLMAIRWFGRAFAFAENRNFGAVLSDVTYSVFLVAGLFVLLVRHDLTVISGTEVLLAASLMGLLGLGGSYLSRQFWKLGTGRLVDYQPIWADVTRWALSGVVLAELTSNAHAYLVTFVSGPHAFAVLAVGALVMRPVSLILGALPDFERPRMARALAAGDRRLVLRSVNEFRTAGGAIWLLTIALAGVLLLWFPHLIIKNGYDEAEVMTVIATWAVIMGARVFRTPEGIMLQAAGAFKPLASASAKSSVVSVVATLILLLLFGPLAALGGILIGELVMAAATIALYRNWKRDWMASHG